MNKKNIILGCLLAGAFLLAAGSPPVLTQTREPVAAFSWPSRPPADCPFPASAQIKALEFTGRHAEYTDADTWYPSWAADGKM